ARVAYENRPDFCPAGKLARIAALREQGHRLDLDGHRALPGARLTSAQVVAGKSRSGPTRAAASVDTMCGNELVLTLVHQRALLDPRHHGAQLGADLLDRMLGELGTGRLERSLVDLVLEHPIFCEARVRDVRAHHVLVAMHV